MPRPRRFRRVCLEPDITYFKPAGVRMSELEETVLSVEEFESIRLKDLGGLEEKEAARKMNISQPTFNRLVTSARRKISEAIVNGKAIKIFGGQYRISGRTRERACGHNPVEDRRP
jgi:uncharacterized protein